MRSGELARRAAGLLAALLVAGCASLQPPSRYEATYMLELASVDQPDAARTAYGAGLLELRADSLAAGAAQNYDDRLVALRFTPLSDRIELEVANKQDRTLQLLWDRAACIDFDGQSVRAVPGTISLDDMDLTLPPAVIAAHSRIQDSVTPANRFLYDDDAYEPGWRQERLVRPVATGWLPPNAHGRDEEARFRSEVATNLGRRLGLLLPLESGGATYEYTFWFRVTAARVAADSSRVVSGGVDVR